MSLISRLELPGPPVSESEDFLSSSLGVIFPDDVVNQHGDADNGLIYIRRRTCPGRPGRRVGSASVQPLPVERVAAAELIEAGTLHLHLHLQPPVSHFDISGLATIELGAGTVLPSLLAALFGARCVVVTDYPAPVVLVALRTNYLWMPWQHDNLRRSVAWFLAFFDAAELAAVGLEVERIWERDCDGNDRPWVWDRGIEDVTERKRWLVVAVLRRVP